MKTTLNEWETDACSYTRGELMSVADCCPIRYDECPGNPWTAAHVVRGGFQ